MSRILLIDDDDALRKMLRLTLVELGHSVIEARNGREGLEAHARHPIDVVLTDIIMPEKEGLETIMELRRGQTPARIVAMSGGGRIDAQDCLALARRLGAQSVLEKPFTIEQMEAALATPRG
jgi:CheY-like chemotaxis protein